MPLTVAVLANLEKNAPQIDGLHPDAWDELDSERTTDAIVAVLQNAGHRAFFLEGDLSLVDKLPALRPDICFNLCEGHLGPSRESHVPAILEMLRIPYTAGGVLCQALTLDKPLTQRVLASHGVRVPDFQVFHNADQPLDPTLRYPLFVKPSREGSSIGIDAASIVRDEEELRRRVADQLEHYRQPILVERFIRGREVTVGLIGNVDDTLTVLPPLEVDLHSYPGGECGIYTSQIKHDPGDTYYYTCPAPLTPELEREIRELAVTVFGETGCRDVARVDFRLDADDSDRPYVIEVNALPGISPGWSDLALAAEASGMAYDDLILGVFDAACRRHGLDPARQQPASDTSGDGRVRVVSDAEGHHGLFALVPFEPGDIVAPYSAACRLPEAERYTVQVGECEHILMEPESLRFINHSCDPSIALDTAAMAFRAVKPIQPGGELTFFYPSTEWAMAEPFECWCGSPRCLGRISGAGDLPLELLAGYDLADHIKALLRDAQR